RNLEAAIEASKDRPLTNLLAGLGVPHLGGAGSQLLAATFGHLDRIMAASLEELAAVEGVGPKIATSVHEFFASERNQAVIAKLRAAGVNLAGPAGSDAPQTLPGTPVARARPQ